MIDTVIFKTTEIKKSYNNNLLYDNFSHTFSGKINVICGKNGSGKSTLIKIMSGIVKPDSGDCLLNGISLKRQRSLYLKNIGYVPDKLNFYPAASGNDFLSLIKKSRNTNVDKHTMALLNSFSLNRSINLPLMGYSYGMKKKLSIAGALISDPLYVFMDEPTNGLDSTSSAAFKEILNSSRSNFIIASHDFNFFDGLNYQTVWVDGQNGTP